MDNSLASFTTGATYHAWTCFSGDQVRDPYLGKPLTSELIKEICREEIQANTQIHGCVAIATTSIAAPSFPWKVTPLGLEFNQPIYSNGSRVLTVDQLRIIGMFPDGDVSYLQQEGGSSITLFQLTRKPAEVTAFQYSIFDGNFSATGPGRSPGETIAGVDPRRVPARQGSTGVGTETRNFRSG